MTIKVGDIVRVSRTCKHTKGAWGVNEEMESMFGKHWKVTKSTAGYDSVKLDNRRHTWHRKDLEELVPPEDRTMNIKPENATFKFDPKEIV